MEAHKSPTRDQLLALLIEVLTYAPADRYEKVQTPVSWYTIEKISHLIENNPAR